jgi:hypothetical protein
MINILSSKSVGRHRLLKQARQLFEAGTRRFVELTNDRTWRRKFFAPGPVLVGVHVDYRDNARLFEDGHERSIQQLSVVCGYSLSRPRVLWLR